VRADRFRYGLRLERRPRPGESESP
jgi:hypothetical protein